jgi:hypothetical protein
MADEEEEIFFAPATTINFPQKKFSVESKTMDVSVSDQIQKIFDTNKVSDLQKFVNQRARINTANTLLMYGFHVCQSSGILLTTIATGYQYQELIWVGVGLNVLSSILLAFEKINTSVSTNLMKNIVAIKDGTYVDEGTIVSEIGKNEKKSNDSTNSTQGGSDTNV